MITEIEQSKPTSYEITEKEVGQVVRNTIDAVVRGRKTVNQYAVKDTVSALLASECFGDYIEAFDLGQKLEIERFMSENR